MPKIILQVYPSLGDTDAMAARRPIGRDNEAVQGMLDGLIEVSRAADDLGYWAITHVEHHFHSEGLEYSPSPLMLNVWASHHTKKIRHGQLGLVVTAHDPIRLAEEIALADHLTRGRAMFGIGPGALPSDAFMLGIDPIRQREMMDEALEAIAAVTAALKLA